MIPLLRGWKVGFLSRGFELTPPEGYDGRSIRVIERQTPLLSLERLLARHLDRLAASDTRELVSVGEVEQLITAQGEFAALATVVSRARRGGELREHTLGAVYGDDWYHRVDAVSPGGLRREARELLRFLHIGLGAQRARRFRYRPPFGWSGLGKGLLTEWYPPGYPAQAASIMVASAWPVVGRAPVHEQLLLMRELSGHPSAHDGRDVSSDHGLAGRLFRRDLASGDIVEQAVFRDDVYVYNLRLDAAPDDHPEAREVFMQLLASCEPLPRVVARVSDDTASFWAS